jgi:hypothetical protein
MEHFKEGVLNVNFVILSIVSCIYMLNVVLSQLQEQQQQQESTLHYLLSSMENIQSEVGKLIAVSTPDQLQAVIHQEFNTFSHK